MDKKLNYRTLALARESRGYSQTELAEEIGVPQSVISRLESGSLLLDAYIKKISDKLQYPSEFFYQQFDIYPPNLHYRKRAVIPAKTKDKAEAMMNIYRANIDALVKGVSVPDVKFPIMDENRLSNPIEVATFIRNYWNLPKGRIENLTQILEERGILVVKCDFFPDQIDGRSMITSSGNYIIFLNSNKPGDRQRFTLAHEFAHLVLHINSPNSLERDVETEANRFASEFLMPSQELIPQIGGSKLTIPKLADLKRFWKVSMQAILSWSEHLGIVTKSQARYLWSQFNSMSIRIKEPVEIPAENSELLEKLITAYLTNLKYSHDELARFLCLNVKDYEKMYKFSPPTMAIAR